MEHIHISLEETNLQQHGKNNNPSSKPVFFAFVIIFLIVGFFIQKSLQKNKEMDAQKQQQIEAQLTNQVINVNQISATDVADKINNKHYQFIDIRDSVSYAQKHIENSVNIPLTKMDSFAVASLDKNRKIIIIDSLPNAANGKQLTQALQKQNFDVAYLEGGIENYVFQNLPTISFGDPNSLEDKSKVTPLSAIQLNERTTKGEVFIFLDVRPITAFQGSHIENAINIPLEEIEKMKKDIPLTGKLVVCDDDPIRSYQAGVKLYDLGYWGIFYLSDSLRTLKEVIEKKP